MILLGVWFPIRLVVPEVPTLLLISLKASGVERGNDERRMRRRKRRMRRRRRRMEEEEEEEKKEYTLKDEANNGNKGENMGNGGISNTKGNWGIRRRRRRRNTTETEEKEKE